MDTDVHRKAAIYGFCVSAFLLLAAPLCHAQSAVNEEEDFATDLEAPALRLPATMTLDDIEEPPKPARPRRKVIADPYAAPGIDLGAFRLFPELRLGAEFSTNAQRSAGGEQDLAVQISPRLRLESHWVRHQLTVTGDAELVRYAEDQNLDSENGSLGAALRLDVRHFTSADFDLRYSLSSTGGGGSDLPATAEGTRKDHSIAVSAAVNHVVGNIEGRLRLSATHKWFDDVELSGGGNEDNGDRDFTEFGVTLRGSLRRDAAIQPFAEMAYEPRIYSRKLDRHGTKRNSHGLRLTAGVTLNDDPIWSGEIGASLLYRNYEDGALADQLTPGLTAALTWQPTDLTRFEFNAGVSLEEIMSAGESAAKSWTVGFKMNHSLRDNLDVLAGLDATLEWADETELTLGTSLGLEWKLNPYLSLSAGYAGTWVESSAAAGDYNEQRLLAAIILKR